MNSLNEKVAIVTGGGTGIGAGIAKALAREGAYVLVCGRRPTPLEAVVGQIGAAGGQADWLVADVSQETDAERIVARALEHRGQIDILVNNAGVSGGGHVHDHDIETWDRVMAINLRGPFLMSRAVLPGMRAQKAGHIIHISSESGLEHYPGGAAYGVSKHGLNALAEITQNENQHLGIRVDTVCPGMVVTEMTENTAGLNQERCLLPEDVADLVLWLVTRRPNVKIGLPVLIQTMLNPWEQS